MKTINENLNLTTREKEIMNLIFSAKSYSQIAIQLGISIETVRKHAHNSYSKMCVKGRSDAKKSFSLASNL